MVVKPTMGMIKRVMVMVKRVLVLVLVIVRGRVVL